ncbi:MAG: hypothetical protein AAFV43_03785 [Planctomycetota bacterium]
MSPRLAAAALLLPLLAAWPADAQRGRSIPGPSYFATLDELYGARIDRAERGFRAELRGAVRTVQARWIDSICYHTMLGETFYRQRSYEAALAQLDQALDLFLANRAWLQTVRLDLPVREDISLARRLPAWAVSPRGPRYCDPPASFLATIGRLDNSQQTQQGGVVQQAQLWQIDAMEVSRTIAWAIYRRGQILGPLAEHDARQRAVNDAVTRGGLAPRKPWSDAWVSLWQGVAAASQGRSKAAAPLLQRCTLLGGQLDYPLTPLALLVRGRIALTAGDASAPQLLREAILAGVAFQDYLVVTESLRLAHGLQLSLEARPLSLLEPLALWATQRGFDEAAILARMAMAESLLTSQSTTEASRLLDGVFGRNRVAARGPLRVEVMPLTVTAALQSGREASQVGEMLRTNASFSLRRFRVALASEQVKSGRLSPRLATDVYATLLADPSGVDWREDPLDSVAAMSEPATEAFGHWFAAAVARRDDEQMLRVIDAESRRRWLAALPFGGRVASLRRLLERPAEPLGNDAIVAKGTLLDRWRVYADWQNQADRLRVRLNAETVGSEAARGWEQTLTARERLIRQIAVSRGDTPLVAAPSLPEDLNDAVLEGEAVIAFRVDDEDVYGVSLVAGRARSWRAGRTKEVRNTLVDLLGAIVRTGRKQQWTAEALLDETWREPAASLGEQLFGEAPAEALATERLTIVPDGLLWHAPWNAVIIDRGEAGPQTLMESGPPRLAPTVGWALQPPTPRSPLTTTVVDNSDNRVTKLDAVATLAPGAVVIGSKPAGSPEALRVVADAVVFGAEQALTVDAPFALELLPRSRSEAATLADWGRLPAEGPRVALLGGVRTGAESLQAALRSRRRGQRRVGDEVFLAVCGLRAPGTRTVLLSQWPTGGLIERTLLAEMVVGLGSLEPREAWCRAVELTRERRLDIAREPKIVEEAGGTPLDASHPLFWAGFLLVD